MPLPPSRPSPSPPSPPPSPRLRRARIAVSAVFFVHGAVFASWAARVPAVQDRLGLTAGTLGLVMAGPGLGALVGSQAGGLLVDRLGSRAVSATAPVSLCVPLALVPAAGSAWTLTAVLVLLGAADGCTSVAMNAQAVVVQRQYGRTVLNSMHAVRSVGAVAGGLAGVATFSSGMTLDAQFTVMAGVLAALSAVAAYGLLPDEGLGGAEPQPRPERAESGETDPEAGADRGTGAGAEAGAGARRTSTTVLLLAVMTFLAALVEDAPASWSGVYLRHIGADAATASAGYAAFSAGSVVTRLLNDRLVRRLGWVRLIRAGTLCCAAVLGAALLLGVPALALVAFLVVGAGISAVFPGAFTAAGALPRPGPAMGQIGFAGNLGWLLVSPLIGGLATLAGLPAALGVLSLAAVLVAVLAPVVRPRPVRTTGHGGPRDG
ncbi:fucose permease [Streptomyces sp. Amel2xB2]|uniref:MFS transporter n=1 Tax=Streptomyces sp. Amel2xB2 TaxID=1305829 RepID=UPI000DB8FEB8|nr:MFS transporter [Streptomyces sp. Amel2xB2]RAJ67100.1 fucose permease [Streptomyces sp. Amel2xB2]